MLIAAFEFRLLLRSAVTMLNTYVASDVKKVGQHQWRIARHLWWEVGIDINTFGNTRRCYFCNKWKLQHFYMKIFLFPKPMGGLTPENPFGYATGHHWSRESRPWLALFDRPHCTFDVLSVGLLAFNLVREETDWAPFGPGLRFSLSLLYRTLFSTD